MSKAAVVFWSSTGNTESMANSVLEGAKQAGAQAELISAADFSVQRAAEFDAIAFGCPAMGAEVLEEDEFQPMWDSVKSALSDKKIALFGSWGWGDGEWMQDWEKDAAQAGITLAVPSVICQETPEDDTLEKCRALGAAIAG